jgi:IclR family pca regulon transcriptional regulator
VSTRRARARGAAQSPLPTPRKADLIEGFITGLATITAFSDVTPRLTASELAARLNLSRAAARRFLITLAHAGYAATDGSAYWLTPRVLALGHSYLGSARLPRTVRPTLQALTAQLQESSNLALLDGADVVYAARANVARLMSTALEPGTRLPAHTTAAGRVILAGLDRVTLDAWLARHPLTQHTAATVTSKKTFAAEVRKAREQGYSAVENQFEAGLRGIAVPLVNAQGEVVGALGVSMASAASPVIEAVRNCLPALQAAARRLRDLI